MKNKFFLSLIFLFGLLILAGFLAPQIAHAQNLHTDLTYNTDGSTAWIFTIWKIMLGIANVIVVAFLLFLAAVNILHLQYDTYQIKKTLPLLIGGAIAANFSILICRMIVDFAQVLTVTFASDPQNLAKGYLCAVGVSATTGSMLAYGAILLPVLILLIVAVLIAIAILAFLLWIRKTVIFLLVAVSPVAFILYAFPPTQGLFKQWWGWFLRWTFMGPIIMLLLWAGSMIGGGVNGPDGCTGIQIERLLIVVGLTFVAGTVPFKLGGAVMGAWGNAGKWLGKKGAGAADYGLAKKTGWSPSAAYQAYKMNNASKRENTLAKATADQRDMQNKLSGQKTEFGRITRKMIAQKQDKEGPGGVGLESLAETVNALNTAVLNNQTDLAVMYMQKIGTNYMGEDAIDFLSDDARKKLGYATGNQIDPKTGESTRVKLNHDIDGQRELLEKLGADDREVAQYEDNLYRAGHVGAMTRLLDKQSGKFYHETDENLLAKINIARSGSTEPGKLVNNTRWQSFFDDEGKITSMGKRLLDEKDGIFQAAHMPYISRGRGRPNVYNSLTRPENWQELDQINPALKESVERAGYHPGWEIEGGRTIKVEDKVVEFSQLDSKYTGNKSIQKQIIAEVKKLPADNAGELASSVMANPNFDRKFAQMVTNISDLKRAVTNSEGLGAHNFPSSQTETTINNIANDGTKIVGNGMRQENLDPRFVVQGILKSAPIDAQEKIFGKLKESMRNSNQISGQLGTQYTTMSAVINAYESLNQPDPTTGNKPNESEKRQRWFSWAQNQGANLNQAGKAWELVEAYLGKPAPKKDEDEETNDTVNEEPNDPFYEDILDDES